MTALRHSQMRTVRTSTSPRQSGFTLIEIMVVVIILGILISLVAPNVFGVLEDAEITATKAQMKSIETALATYRMNHRRYPSSDEGLAALTSPPGRDRGYLDTVPKDSWNNEYQYRSPGLNGDYDLYSFGRDGQEGGEGPDADISHREQN